MNNLIIYCVTNKSSNDLEALPLKLAGVGKCHFSKKYINCKTKKNIQRKEKNYSELTFHYWFWKNKLSKINKNIWIGFCQKRRFWIKQKIKINSFSDLKKNIIVKIPKKWEKFESILCKPISVSNPKRIKMIKRGVRNYIKDPTIFFLEKKHTIKLHFDMHHGYGVLDKAINLMDLKDREEFRHFISTKNTFSPHIMFITKKKFMNKWFKDLFKWLFKCEKIFGFKNLKGYDQTRLYAYLAERYLSFWFNKYTKVKKANWTFFDVNTN